MTEAEWNSCTEPQKMLHALRASGITNGRKLRLFAVACCRLLLRQVRVVPSAEHAVDVAERYADGAASVAELRGVARFASSVAELRGVARHAKSAAVHACRNAAEEEVGTDMADAAAGNAAWAAAHTGRVVEDDNGQGAARFAAQEAIQSDLLHCICGPVLFRPLPPVTPAVLAWQGGTVGRLAAAVYKDRAFTPEQVGVLADALEDAGCDKPDLLDHLRGPGPHVRGCWVLDLLLGKS
jgi:hypothetical protein